MTNIKCNLYVEFSTKNMSINQINHHYKMNHRGVLYWNFIVNVNVVKFSEKNCLYKIRHFHVLKIF